MRKLYNLREYHRPPDLDEAKRLLHRKGIRTVPLAGGSSLIGEASPDLEAVVDLDGLKLDFIEYENGALYLGAMLRLQTIVEKLADISDVLLADAARRMAGWHIRNTATVGGVLASGDIHSPLSIALAALKARVKIYEQPGEMPLWADLSKEVRRQGLKGKLITAISLNLPESRMGAAYQQVARTPADRPIVSAASVVYESGDTVQATTAIGGLLNDILVFSQRVSPDKADAAREELAAEISKTRTPETSYQSDFLGSADYRRDVAPKLAQRALLAALERLNQPLA